MKYKINLLNKKDISLIDKVVYFSINYLRYIVVITMLIIIFVFFYRFQLDQQIIDLKESMIQKNEIIKVVLPLLKEGETIEKKQMAAKMLLSDQNNTLSFFKYFISIFPKGLILDELIMEKDSINIVGTTIQLENLQAFINLAKKEKKFKEIDLRSLKKVESGFNFELRFSNFYD